MEKISTRTLEITIISAEDLKVRGRPVKKSTFVTVTPETASEECLRSKMDNNGGSNPHWSDKQHIELPMHTPFIKAHVYCASSNGKARSLIGTAVIPVTDFAAANYLHRLSYRLKDRTGDRNGILNISVSSRAQPAAAPPTTSSCKYDSSYGYGSWMGRPVGESENNWVALGIPVSVSHPYPLIQ